MKYILCIISIVIFSSCQLDNSNTIATITASTYKIKNISRGNNAPKIDITKDSLHIFLMALHAQIPIAEIVHDLQWSEATKRNNINRLLENKLLIKRGDNYIPNLCVFTSIKGELLIKKSALLAQEIADSIVPKLKDIHTLHNKTDISKKYSFHDLSFFYLSAVLLDNGQINNIERDFLGKERPLRNGSRYYLAILEKEEENSVEPFGIYGNQVLFRSDSVIVAAYGNTRTQLNKGWQDYQHKKVHSFSKNDLHIVSKEMPKTFLATYLKILNKHKPTFVKIYKELAFEKETSFEEFFIWYYHIIYTQTTDLLIKQQLIKKPTNGLFYYEFKMR
ncbi:MAG: hypothetical protein COB81_04810 [Flavobacteriaceae bacterium]|nr:MAG: hypothetical protein COB81_04810 [Flavobacteriaceae bacterium]